MAECSHDCSSCSQKCSKESLLAPMNKASNVKRVIGVVSGKGGVGKSLITSMLAVTMRRRGYKTAVLDADITGPSIPKSFGLKCGSVEGSDLGMFPPQSKTGIEIMRLFNELHREGNTIILITHEQEIADYAIRNVYIKDGTIHYDRLNTKRTIID